MDDLDRRLRLRRGRGWACLRQYLDGSARRPGLWMMGHLAEPVRLFRDMEQLGLRVSTTLS